MEDHHFDMSGYARHSDLGIMLHAATTRSMPATQEEKKSPSCLWMSDQPAPLGIHPAANNRKPRERGGTKNKANRTMWSGRNGNDRRHKKSWKIACATRRRCPRMDCTVAARRRGVRTPPSVVDMKRPELAQLCMVPLRAVFGNRRHCAGDGPPYG